MQILSQCYLTINQTIEQLYKRNACFGLSFYPTVCLYMLQEIAGNKLSFADDGSQDYWNF